MNDLKIQFVKANPSGNTTILALTPLPRDKYAQAASLLMNDNVIGAEQVGYVEKTESGSRLEMMGGEFCANASRSYAAWLAMGGYEYLDGGGEIIKPLLEPQKRVQVEVSGANCMLEAQIEDIGCEYGCFSEISMPAPEYIRHGSDKTLGEYSIVGFSGIVHGVLWEKAADEDLTPYFLSFLQIDNFI